MKAILDFLTDLRKNNNREWFNDNRKRYEESKEQMLFFTELMIQEIHKFDPEIPFLNPKDCLFRIFRDVRFSKDKSPYKTQMGSFIAKHGRKSDRAGYYIHIDPGNSFLGGGIWRPQADTLKVIRTEIFENANDFKEILADKDFAKYFSLMNDDKLKMAPKGFPKDFEDIELLKHKSYVFGYQIDDKTISEEQFVSLSVDVFRELHKANRFINHALDKK
ncbi:DUF2461 domain-containing protein [Sunxiuqinia indica]|uniref:DUF2461 domain-containing protein n=1 Tax=Sunxiuqinia indica TaxID=2692584 RepID=UPI00135C7605|nr:DUF2461 domain-containing protein [Sunxiuqinia indica]